MRKVDFAETLSVLTLVVLEHGTDKVYEKPMAGVMMGGPSCLYALNGEPDCLVGHVLARLGVPVPDMEWSPNEETCGRFSSDPARTVIDRLRSSKMLNLDWRSSHLLSAAQCAQDGGDNWGNALRLAIKEVSTAIRD